MHRTLRCLPLAIASWIVSLTAVLAAEPAPEIATPEIATPATAMPEIAWQTDYAEAMQRAKDQRKMLLIFFHDPDHPETSARFEAETLDDAAVRTKLADFVCVKLPLGAKTTVGGEELTLLEHATFAEMLGRPGVAIIDQSDPDARTYGCVVSTFPLTAELWYDAAKMQVILDLPPGTLTQRTLIYAVRVHPERPASTNGQIDQRLLNEAESHSQHQANIRLQGHHQWSARFVRISAEIPGNLTPCEVCAESWPGERLVEAAIECVRCWRYSSGHWSAVSAAQAMYGYDMKRGSNGVWYATGIFGGK